MREAEQRRCDGELLHDGPFLGPPPPLSFTASSSPAHLLSDDGEVA
jgi:hypothetical protein